MLAEAAEVQVALINAIGIVMAALFPSGAVLFASKIKRSREKLQADLAIALADVQYLLCVEAEHCRLHQENSGVSNHRVVRKTVSAVEGLTFSGRFTKSRIQIYRQTYLTK